MATISLRVSEIELKAFKAYARHNQQSLSETVRLAMLDKIENEYGIRAFATYAGESSDSAPRVRPIRELWKDLAL